MAIAALGFGGDLSDSLVGKPAFPHRAPYPPNGSEAQNGSSGRGEVKPPRVGHMYFGRTKPIHFKIFVKTKNEYSLGAVRDFDAPRNFKPPNGSQIAP